MLVESKIDVKEVDGTQVPMGSKPMLLVKSHYAEPAYVQLEFGGKRYTVLGKELIKAVKNIIE